MAYGGRLLMQHARVLISASLGWRFSGDTRMHFDYDIFAALCFGFALGVVCAVPA
jgi:hypothetical protein